MNCNKCGKGLSENEIFCMSCGGSTQGEAGEGALQPSESSQNSAGQNNDLWNFPNQQAGQQPPQNDPWGTNNTGTQFNHSGQSPSFQPYQPHGHHQQSPQHPQPPSWHKTLCMALPILSWILNIISGVMFQQGAATPAVRLVIDIVSVVIAITGLVLIVRLLSKYKGQRMGCFLAIAIFALIIAITNTITELAFL